MSTRRSLYNDIKTELGLRFVKPRTELNSLFVNSLISLAFFFTSYAFGTYNTQLLPIAAATILLWTLADSSITNQLLYDKDRNARELKKYHSLKHVLLVKNATVMVLAIPLTLVFGIILAFIVNSWIVVLYGFVMAFVLLWGWLGISNILSVYLPFEPRSLKELTHDKQAWIRYTVLYCLPCALLPLYAILLSLPLYFAGWTKAETAQSHRIGGLLLLFSFSLFIWLISLKITESYAQRATSRIKKHIDW